MKKGFLLFFCITLLLLPNLPLFSVDLGLVLDQTAGVSGSGDTTTFDYTGTLIPWLSAFITANNEFYMSAGLNMDFKSDTWTFIPELLRTELSGRFNNGSFNLGRMSYSDPLGFVADGLFDGARFAFDTRAGIFSLGAWYTGLLYKDRAKITMTAKDLELAGTDLDFSNFTDTYFAPKRIVAALGWEHPSIGNFARAKISALGQFDMTGEDFNTQYFVGKLSLPGASVVLDLGACLELKEESGEDLKTAIAGEASLAWLTPIPVYDRLMLLGRYSSGSTEAMSAFVPVTTVGQGSILKPKLSGISIVSVDYAARLAQSFAMSVSSNYFIRTDGLTYLSYPVDQGTSEGYFLGNEFFAWLLWSPVSDLRINLGGGIFLPSMGNVAPEASNLWRVELNVILSLY